MKIASKAPLPASSGWRQVCAISYEVLLTLPPILLFAGGYFYVAPQVVHSIPQRALLFAYLAICVCIYHTLYLRIGQKTLAMASWKLRIASDDGGDPKFPTLILRDSVALLSFIFLGIGHLWAFLDPERRFLHDRVAGTALRPDIAYQ